MSSDTRSIPKGSGYLAELKAGLGPHQLGPNLIAGLVTSILAVVEAVSHGALIFSGSLASQVAYGVGVTLIAAAVAGLVTAVLSSYPGAIALPQNQIAPIVALLAASVAARMPPGSSPEVTLLTVLATIILTSLATGVFLSLLGIFRLGRLIRFIPYQVIAGFLAGAGWLLVLGSIKTMTGKAVTLHSVPELLTPVMLARWLPGLGFALIALAFMRRFKHFLVLPGMLAASVTLFYVILLVNHIPLAQAREAGWLFHLNAGNGLAHFMTVKSLRAAVWPVVFNQAGGIATILFVSSVSVLLIASALELASERELDLDRELKVAGASNLLTGLAGGMVAFTSLSVTSLALKLGGRTRLVGLMTATAAALTLLAGAGVLSYCPEPVIGGLLLYLGLSMVIEWAVETRRKLPRSAWMTVLIILASVGLFGFLPGVMVGVVAAIITFVVRYSGVDVIKTELTGAHFQSNVDRPPAHLSLLRECGDRLVILKLHGFIFFGTANHLLTHVAARAEDRNLPPLKFMALDFQEVTGIDASAVISMIKMQLLARRLGFTLVFTHLGEIIRGQMEHSGLDLASGRSLTTFPDLDHGIEYCEDELLLEQGVSGAVEQHPLREYFETLAPGALDFDEFASYLERFEAPAGQTIIAQGDASDNLLFLESGVVTVQIRLDSGEDVRLRKMGAGTVVGELGLYLGQPRAASVVTESDAVLFRLTRAALQKMEEASPATAAAFHRIMVVLLAQRLVNTDRTLKALLD